jgi:hypothetical protein
MAGCPVPADAQLSRRRSVYCPRGRAVLVCRRRCRRRNGLDGRDAAEHGQHMGGRSAVGSFGDLPQAIPVTPGTVVTLDNAGGTWSCDSPFGGPGNQQGPDGDGVTGQNCDPPVIYRSYGGLSGIYDGSRAQFITGVFLASSGQPATAPGRLDFTDRTGLEHSFTSLSPQLGQLFFIGDGLAGTGTGSIQQFIAPPGAATLYLGYTDAPDAYNDNQNAVTATVHVTPTHQLTVTKAGIGGGTVTSSPAGIDCGQTCSSAFPAGAQIILSATPPAGSTLRRLVRRWLLGDQRLSGRARLRPERYRHLHRGSRPAHSDHHQERPRFGDGDELAGRHRLRLDLPRLVQRGHAGHADRGARLGLRVRWLVRRWLLCFRDMHRDPERRDLGDGYVHYLHRACRGIRPDRRRARLLARDRQRRRVRVR